MAWGGAGGGFGGPSAVADQRGRRACRSPECRPELADRVEAILETEPEHPSRARPRSPRSSDETAPFTLRRFLATRKAAMAVAFALVLVETLDAAGRSAADPARHRQGHPRQVDRRSSSVTAVLYASASSSA